MAKATVVVGVAEMVARAGAEELVLACMFGLGHRTLSCPRLSETETAEVTGRMILSALHAL